MYLHGLPTIFVCSERVLVFVGCVACDGCACVCGVRGLCLWGAWLVTGVCVWGVYMFGRGCQIVCVRGGS